MDILLTILALVIAAGAAIAIYEWKHKKTLLKHDLNLANAEQSETDREIERAVDVFTHNTHH